MSSNILKGYSKNKKEILPEFELQLEMNKIMVPEFIERTNINRDGIAELAENIKRVGLINPLLVKVNGQKFEIVAGHRRYLALRLLGAALVRVVVIKGKTADTEFIKLSENLMREDLNDVEEATMLERLKKITKNNEAQIARQIGKSEGYVRQKLQILKYPEGLFRALQAGQITFSVARELIRLKNANMLDEYLHHAITGGATPALVKGWVDDIIAQEKRDVLINQGQNIDTKNIKPVKHFYECELCKEKADLTNSQLYRIHAACWKEINN